MQNRKPQWLKIKIQDSGSRKNIEEMLKRLSLNTVCGEANCPNLMECFSCGTATFMILGKTCTRNCTFCNVSKDRPEDVDKEEPAHVALAVKELKLKHAVVTSVTRDDLEDGGASHFALTVKAIKNLTPATTIEVLIPDFKGDITALKKVADALPEVINHNIETIERLYDKVRPMASYARSLELLKRVKELNPEIKTKSGIMVGLGETKDEVLKVLKDLRTSGCELLTIGQYLAPSKAHHPVIEYIHPDIFKEYENKAYKMGFSHVASGPFVRSSYHAGQALKK